MNKRISPLSIAIFLGMLAFFFAYPARAGDEDGRVILPAGPIQNDVQAQERCPEVVAEWLAEHPGEDIEWTGHWWTTVPGEMSVCVCESQPEEEPANG